MKHLYYISGPEGLAGVYVKQTGQTDDKLYYAEVDHLGSILKLTDEMGNEVFSATYDAWGNRTVTNNTFDFHRGYTGHEHLPEFGLINMNGRMYDPALGRMLSPDAFVQSPLFSQSYNRYSYCVNNPLKFSDPSGMESGDEDDPKNGGELHDPVILRWYPSGRTHKGPWEAYFDRFNSLFDPIDRERTKGHVLQINLDVVLKNTPISLVTTAPLKLPYTLTNHVNSSAPENYKGSGTFDDPYQLDEVTIRPAYTNTFGYMLFGDLVSGSVDDGGYGPYTPASWRAPDFYSLNVAMSFSGRYKFLGGGFNITIDRHLQIYISPEISAGKTSHSWKIAGSLTANWMLQATIPTPSETRSFLLGLAINGGAGYYGGINWTYSPLNSGTKNALGLGLFTPQIGAGVSYVPNLFYWNLK